MKKWILFLLIISNLSTLLFAQKKQTYNPTSNSKSDSTLASILKWRNIGPFRGGRSSAVVGVQKEINSFYFGSTGGGVWKTSDGGSNWKNISDKFFGGSIGAITVANSDQNIIWAGEGEQTLRGNVSEGNGIWKSIDGGRTWKNMGLRDSRHIVRICIHPKNPDIVFVSVIGHLFGPNTERGIFRTKDGGQSWQKILFVNADAGGADLCMDPTNPDILFASLWNVRRTGYSLESGGVGSSIWKSKDGGDTWIDLSLNDGMPKAPLGIICVSVSPANPDLVWAMVEANEGGLFKSNDGGQTWTRINEERKIRQRAWYFSRVYADTKEENTVYVLNVQFHKSTDGGKTFKEIYTPHGDHHDLWIDPENNKRIIVGDDGGAQITFDGGENWSTYHNQPTSQFYRISTDNHFPYRIYGSQQDNSSVRIEHRSFNSGGISQNNWENTAGGESGYHAIDPLNEDIVYGGNYGGYLERYNHRTGEYRDITVWPDNPIGYGGDSLKFRFQWNFPIFFSPNNSKKLYAAGNVLFSTTDEGHSWKQISPDLTRNDKTKMAASGGIITKDNTGVEIYGTIFYAVESKQEKGLIWCGSDDGLINVTIDSGTTWTNVTPKEMPEWMMINCLEIDPFIKGGLYAVGTRYKMDDYQPYIYHTNDYGKTWQKIITGINPMHFTRCLRADPYKQGLLYCGTEYGMYISYNDGKNWQPWQLNLPIVPITDLTIKDYDLIVATQGRSFWVLDDISKLHQWNDSVINKPFFLFKPRDTWRAQSYKSGQKNEGENPEPGVSINYYLKQKADTGNVVKLEFLDKDKKLIKAFASNATKDNEKLIVKKGMNQFSWNMMYPDAEKFEGLIMWSGGTGGPMAPTGIHYVKLIAGKDSMMQQFVLKKPNNVEASDDDLTEQFNFQIKVRDKLSEVNKAVSNIRLIKSQISTVTSRLKNEEGKDLKTLADTINKNLTLIEETLYQTKLKAGQDALNYPIKLNDKIAGVMSAASSGNRRPPQQCYDVFKDLSEQADIQLNRLKNIMTVDLKNFNDVANNLKIPAVYIKDDK